MDQQLSAVWGMIPVKRTSSIFIGIWGLGRRLARSHGWSTRVVIDAVDAKSGDSRLSNRDCKGEKDSQGLPGSMIDMDVLVTEKRSFVFTCIDFEGA